MCPSTNEGSTAAEVSAQNDNPGSTMHFNSIRSTDNLNKQNHISGRRLITEHMFTSLKGYYHTSQLIYGMESIHVSGMIWLLAW